MVYLQSIKQIYVPIRESPHRLKSIPERTIARLVLTMLELCEIYCSAVPVQCWRDAFPYLVVTNVYNIRENYTFLCDKIKPILSGGWKFPVSHVAVIKRTKALRV